MSPKRNPVPGVDILFSGRQQAVGANESPDNVKTTTYLRADQMQMLEDMIRDYKSTGERWVKGAHLIRAALDVALADPEAWSRTVMRNGAG